MAGGGDSLHELEALLERVDVVVLRHAGEEASEHDVPLGHVAQQLQPHRQGGRGGEASDEGPGPLFCQAKKGPGEGCLVCG